jgi:DNA-binding transcriptional LysR family regulator
MQDLNDLFYFSIVVDKGGFSAAGRALGIPKSRLSRRIAQLEERLGVRLLQRSTRRFVVTDAGQRFYEHCQAVIAQANAAEEAVAQLVAEPRGLLRVSCPVALSQGVMTTILPGFLEKYPHVKILLLSTNRRIDVIGEGVDLALRVRSRLDTDADLIMREFGRGKLLMVASPDYLRRRGYPQQPADLSDHDTISMLDQDAGQHWELAGLDGEVMRVALQPRVMCGDFPVILSCALRGLGIALLPQSVCVPHVASGKLEIILPQWSPPDGILHCVFPSRRGLLPSVRALIDWLAEQLPRALGPDLARI